MDCEIELINELNIDFSLEEIELYNDNLNVLYLNTRSCRNKEEQLCLLINEFRSSIHVVVFAETWLHKNEIFNLRGYDAYHSCRDGRGGGVSIFVLSTLRSQLLLEISENDSNFLIIELIDPRIKIMGVYNPGRLVPLFLDQLEQIMHKFKRMVICGDFNINLLDATNEFVYQYKHKIQSLGYIILNKIDSRYATRISNTICTVIDHFITDIFDCKMHLHIRDTERCISDHKTLVLSIKTSKLMNDEFVQKKTYINYDNILRSVSQTTFHSSTHFSDISEKLNAIINENKTEISFRKKSMRIRKPYINNELLVEIRQKNEVYKQYKNATTDRLKNEFYQVYVRMRNALKNKIKYSKEQHYGRKLCQNAKDYRKTWSILREIIFQRSCSKSNAEVLSLKENNEIIPTDALIANCFNEYFVNIGLLVQNNSILQRISSANSNFIVFMSPQPDVLFSFSVVNDEKVTTVLKSLNASAAVGLDKISTRFLQKCSSFITPKLTQAVNNMIQSSHFEDCLKIAKIVPLYKSGDKFTKTNYRPVSILPALSKIPEYIINEQIKCYLLQNNLLNKNQFGFLPKKSTESASLELLNFIVKGLDEGEYVGCIFIDLCKAFDCIPHDLLIAKLSFYGFTPSAVSLLKSYLSNRKQQCCVNGVLSEPLLIKSGVPQGSIVGPILFNLFVNDIFNVPLKGTLQCYADDAVCKYKAKDLESLQNMMQYDLHLLPSWFSANKMQINSKKSNFIIFSLKNPNPRFELTINNENLAQVTEVDYLGLAIDENLNWKRHIRLVKNKIMPIIFALKKARHCLSIQSCWQLYNAFILPHLTYMNTIWGSAGVTHLNVLKVLQNRAIKYIRKLPLFSPTATLYSPEILPLDLLHKYNCLLFVYKIKHNLVDSNIRLIEFQNIHAHETRARQNFFVSRPRTELALRHFFYTGVTQFNALPNYLKTEERLTVYKKKLKKYVFENV